MSHSHHMDMGSGSLPALEDFPKLYYAVIGTAVGIATLVNIYNHVLCRQRLAAARAGSLTPSKPKSWFTLANATLFALTREASNFSVHIPLKNRILRLPTVGRTSLVLANVVVLVVLCLYGLDLKTPIKRETVGFRCGVVTLAQLPLIFLLSGKNNIIGFLSGVSYERLNWLHRWCARCMLLTATLHMGYFFDAWAPYDYIGIQLKQNKLVWRGLAAWCTLVWIVFSSMTPIRGWSYEVFVLQHVVSFALFIGFVYLHTPVELNVYIWIPVALFFFDRLFRALRIAYANISLFHSSQKGKGQGRGFWTCKGEFTSLPHNTTRITIRNPPISWTPGQHVFLSCHSVVPLQNHPFTIASIPEDGKMEFLVKAEKGGTRRFFRHAKKAHDMSDASARTRTVLIEGPYGCHRPLRQFDSLVLLAGSTGASFTVPLLRDILQGWKENAPGQADHNTSFLQPQIGAVTRSVQFVWVIKSRYQLECFSAQLSSVCADFQSLQQQLRHIKLELMVYITCDETFTEEHNSLLSTVTDLKPRAEADKRLEHGTVELRSRTIDEYQEAKGTRNDVKELATINDMNYGQAGSGPCKCRATINESPSADTIAPCCCSPADNASETNTSRRARSSSISTRQKFLVHPSIRVFSGRPNTRDIICRSLEQALGESAVVVCGPQGLVADVKQNVCSLSDERAVHKGTGSQGIYLHTESFGY